MADIFNDYQSGTVSVENGDTAVTGVGSAWSLAAIRPGDLFMRAGLVVPIASVESNTGLTLAEPWPGASLEDSAYRIRYQPDGSRYTAAARALVESVEDYYPAMQILAEGGSDGQIMGNAGGSPSWVDNVGYAEGTWTPYITFGDAAVGQAYNTTSTQGGWVRIGNLVFARFQIVFTNKGTSTGAAKIAGLPLNIGGYSGVLSIGFYSGMSLSVGGITAFPSAGTVVSLRTLGTATTASITDTNFTNTSILAGGVIYETDAA